MLDSDRTVALKIVEWTKEIDTLRLEGLEREVENYALLEQAYANGVRRLSPEFLGYYGDEKMNVLILELLASSVKHWSELEGDEK